MTVRAGDDIERVKERDDFLRDVITELQSGNKRWPGLWTRLSSLMAERDRLQGRLAQLETAMRHVISDSPGTLDSVKKYLVRELEGSWGESYEQAMVRAESRP